MLLSLSSRKPHSVHSYTQHTPTHTHTHTHTRTLSQCLVLFNNRKRLQVFNLVTF